MPIAHLAATSRFQQAAVNLSGFIQWAFQNNHILRSKCYPAFLFESTWPWTLFPDACLGNATAETTILVDEPTLFREQNATVTSCRTCPIVARYEVTAGTDYFFKTTRAFALSKY